MTSLETGPGRADGNSGEIEVEAEVELKERPWSIVLGRREVEAKAQVEAEVKVEEEIEVEAKDEKEVELAGFSSQSQAVCVVSTLVILENARGESREAGAGRRRAVESIQYTAYRARGARRPR